jgi:hypothetical protein
MRSRQSSITKKNRNAHNGVGVGGTTQSSQSSPRIITSDNAIVGDLSASSSSLSMSMSSPMIPRSSHNNNNNLTNDMPMPIPSSLSSSSSSLHYHDSNSRSSHNTNTNTNKGNISTKEKADFNARLEQRRRQRRDQRLRREHRKDIHRHTLYGKSGLFRGFKTKHFIVFTCCFIVIVFGWIFGFYFLMSVSQDMDIDGSKASPLQLLKQNRGKILKDIKDTASSKLKSLEDNAALKLKSLVQKKTTTTDKKIDDANTSNANTDNTDKNKNNKGDFINILDVQDNSIDEYDSNTPLLKGDINTIIDMRQLSYELPFADEDGGAWKQGWDVQPIEIDNSGSISSSTPLKIIVVPHSHCDPGWIQTFDEYFQSQTKQILSSIIESLMKDPKRTFIWAEISYFEWWWKEQNSIVKNNVRHLLQNKQFEFVTGGWVQPDEANTQLYAMEIQLEEGHDFIAREFGSKYIPKYGWSIDPFGYSPTMAYLLKKHGFKGMLIQRVHYAIKKELALHKNLEFMWRQTWDNGSADGSEEGEYDIFTHVMPFYSYDVPHTCGPDPSICCQFDFARLKNSLRGGGGGGNVADYAATCPWHKPTKEITSKNIKERSLLLLDQYRKKANLYRTNTVLIPLGDDFRYRSIQEADAQYDNYSLIIDYINKNVDNVDIKFGTLSDYFQTIMYDKSRRFNPPILKGSFFTYSDREQDYWSGYYTSRIFDKALDRQLERVLYAATSLGATKQELQNSRRALSLFQHHDGVTGTAKSYVVEDYAKRIHTAIKETQNWILMNLVQERSKHLAKQLKLQPCWQSTAPRGLSQNLCDHNTEENGKTTTTTATTTPIIVYNPLETPQKCGSVIIPGRQIAHATLPCEIPKPKKKSSSRSSNIKFDPNTGLMISPIREEWMVWKVKKGGAYLFFPGTLGSYNEYNLHIESDGAIVTTNNWKRTVVEREIEDDDGTTTVVIDFIYETNLQTNNEEWFARFTSPDIKNEGIFHTDLNGYNFDTHHFRSDMPIQSQVFPMPTLASIEDSSNRMTILSEHAQGAASIEESAVDIWLDRRLAQDDQRGLEQGVMDNVPTRTRLRVVLEPRTTKTVNDEFEITPFCKLQWKELNHPLEMFGSASGNANGAAAAAAKEGGGEAAAAGGFHLSNPFAGAQHLVLPDMNALELDNRSIEEKLSSKGRKIYNPEDEQHNKHLIGRAGEEHGDKLYNVAAVFMVYKRVDYFKQAIETLRKSDYPKTLSIIISHDGHEKEMVDFVESIKSEFKIIQLFHPYSCSDHPNTFPGDDPKLNENYEGDTFGNKRDSKITCCKHHFTWLINTVFNLQETKNFDGFLFLEEDYIVAPTIYETIQKGYRYIDTKHRQNDFFGLTFDPSDGYAYRVPKVDWIEKKFITVSFLFILRERERVPVSFVVLSLLLSLPACCIIRSDRWVE